MSQTEKYSPEEKQMELDMDDGNTTKGNDDDINDLDLITPQQMDTELHSFSNDLQYLCGTSVPNNILHQLQRANITTFEEILLTKTKDRNRNLIDSKQLTELQQMIATHYYSSIQIKYLSTIIAQNNDEINYHSTAITKLDKLINETNPGIPTKSITSFIGASSSGKTLILYQIAAFCALNGGNVIFIDSHNQFDGQRLYDVLKGIQCKTKGKCNERNIMKRIKVYSVCSLIETFDLIQSDDFLLNIKMNNVDIIMIDNMGLNSYQFELNTTFYCHGEICKLSRKLKYFALKYNLSVITSSLSLNNIYQNEYWINSSFNSLYKNWYNYIDHEIHLLLTTRFAVIKPILTKSRKKVTYKYSDILLGITQCIDERKIHK